MLKMFSSKFYQEIVGVFLQKDDGNFLLTLQSCGLLLLLLLLLKS